jgi:hypothetical protein
MSGIAAGLCFIVLFGVFCAGCSTPPAKAPEAGISQPVQTAASPAGTIQQASAPTQAASAVATAPATTPSPQPIESATLTINSASKQTKIYTYTPNQGRIFLVLDITVANHDLSKGLDISDTSLTLTDLTNSESQILSNSANPKVRGALQNPFAYPTRIPLGETRSGQLAFGVRQNSNSYRLALADSNGIVLSTARITAE